MAKYAATVATMEKAGVPEETKEATRRNYLFEQSRAALAKHNLCRGEGEGDRVPRPKLR